MLTSDQLDALIEPVVELYRNFEDDVIRDIARRLAGLHISSAAWQVQRLSESGMIYEDILNRLARLTHLSDLELRDIFWHAGVRSLKFDDAVYIKAGLHPIPLNLSPAMANVLAAGLRKTQGIVRNLTLTTAISGQTAFINAADNAYLKITSGAFDYNTAIRKAVKDMASQGIVNVNLSLIHI